jgi:glycosyltransferase involved in cell wall biosynthesis
MGTDTPTRFSMIVPAYNEAKFLPRLLDSIDVARSAYRDGPGAIEVIIADNSSTDKTAEIATLHGCRIAPVSKRAIAAARNGGAHIAQGNIFCFIDADSQIHPRTFEAIDEALANDQVIAGATGVWLERKSSGILFTYCLMVPFVWLTGMDTGVVFCRREDFQAIGGYDESRIYAEDVAFLLALRRRGRQHKQRLTRLRSVKAMGSTRKFDDFGDWHYFSLAFRAGLGFIKGQATDREIADRYWYRPRR